jgi:feruloyl esterase
MKTSLKKRKETIMKRLRPISKAAGLRARHSLGFGAGVLGLIGMATLALMIAVEQPAHAAISSCTYATLQAAAPPGVTIQNIPDLNGFLATLGPIDGVLDVAAGASGLGAGYPEECLVTGTVVTNPATGKTANFAALLPAKLNWNGKFMFTGCGGNCGTAMSGLPSADVLNKGYPVWATDDGHLASDTIWPTTSAGVLDEDSVIDFAYRAVHTVVVLGKQFTLNYYRAKELKYSYYEGCSDGGREGMVSANRYPWDFDGILAGDPYFDVGGQNIILSNDTVQLRTPYPDAAVSPVLMALASSIVMAQCDAVDGVVDGLIQDPAKCFFNPQTDLPLCPTNTPNCFTQDQKDSLTSMLTAMTDPHGTVIHPGFPVSDMNTIPGANLALWAGVSSVPISPFPGPWGVFVPNFDWIINASGIYYWAYLGEATPNSVSTLGFTYQSGGPGPIQWFHTIAPENTIDKIYNAMNIASADFPEKLSPFIEKKGKLILYHGYSDGLITPYRTIQYFQELAELNGGYEKLGENVRLFMVPGMYHCAGGPGPNNFGQSGVQPVVVDAEHDATTALEQWVEEGIAPKDFIATTTGRTMPLCPYPAMAHYIGAPAPVDVYTSWTCPQHDFSLLQVGPDGHEAGVDAPLFTPGYPF